MNEGAQSQSFETGAGPEWRRRRNGYDVQPFAPADGFAVRRASTLGSTVTEIVLGDEYDDALFARLAVEIAALGGVITDKEWTLGGGQDVTVFQITLPDGNIEAVAETYIGLSLRGPTELVEQLARRVMPDPLLQRTASPPAERRR